MATPTSKIRSCGRSSGSSPPSPAGCSSWASRRSSCCRSPRSLSYLAIRPTTRRLDDFTAATGALRQGTLAARVPVEGEDEVAHLQTDFNVMAADLERSVGELEAERDTVSRLLAFRRELVTAVSHELRTPVATIRAYLEFRRSTTGTVRRRRACAATSR